MGIAISERGFNPLNKNLLLRNDLRRTMTEMDKEQEDKLHILTQDKLSTIDQSSAYHVEHPLNFNFKTAVMHQLPLINLLVQ